ncbi:hypothetical protein CGZ75_13030 [Paenibacillus herberti]|uniref:Glycosyl hydrolase family 98 putative carbohydrate-binding module domain-containing protein n=1 Tax=Paenibacillus herberti TaxID=1619309 RepID=A0A229NVP9_9BACL|nr:hypothetical protein CGZ75_13030 [Paenibacillus herberti]
MSGFVGIDDFTKDTNSTGTVIILGDGQEIFRKDGLKGGDLPLEINVDLTGVLKLQIQFESSTNSGGQIDIVIGDAKLLY